MKSKMRKKKKKKKKKRKEKKKEKEKEKKTRKSRSRSNGANTICSTSANSISASWPKSNWPKLSILGPSPRRRHSRCCLELLCHTGLCYLTRSVRSSFLREPPGSFHSGFCRVRSRQSSAVTFGHCDLFRSSCTTQCLRRSELGPRTCTQPVLVHFIPNLVSERFHGYFILSFPQNIGDQRRWFLEDHLPNEIHSAT